MKRIYLPILHRDEEKEFVPVKKLKTDNKIGYEITDAEVIHDQSEARQMFWEEGEDREKLEENIPNIRNHDRMLTVYKGQSQATKPTRSNILNLDYGTSSEDENTS